jgi:hypothetical protein
VAGATDKEVREAIELGERVKKTVAMNMRSFTDILVTEPGDPRGAKKAPGNNSGSG